MDYQTSCVPKASADNSHLSFDMHVSIYRTGFAPENVVIVAGIND